MSVDLQTRWKETLRGNPEAVALIVAQTGQRWTRQELESAVTQCHAGWDDLVKEGIRGRRVVLAAPNGVEWWVAFLAILQMGGIPALLDASESDANRLAVASAIGAVALWKNGRLEWIPDISEGATAPGRVILPRREKGYQTVALLKLTSGTTGTPKVLAFTHEQMIADGENICATMGLRAEDVNLAVIPLGHSYGLGNLVMPLLLQGTAMVLAESALPRAIEAAAVSGKATVFPAVPAILRVLSQSDVSPEAFAGVRLVITAGAVLPPGMALELRSKLGLSVHSFYGTSETGGICFDRTGHATLEGRSIGTPLEGVRLEWKRGSRFIVESGAVMSGGTYSPPDLGALNSEGELVLLGRAGRMVKIGGRRLELAEVEGAIRGLPEVREVVAFQNPGKSDSIAVVVAVDQLDSASGVNLRRLLTTRMAAWKVPDRWVVVAELPYTSRGKLDLRQMREWVQKG